MFKIYKKSKENEQKQIQRSTCCNNRSYWIGKTTLTQNINVSAKCLKIPEPVEKWESCGILKDFYSDMKANAFSFQMFAFASRASQFKEIEWSNYDVCMSRFTYSV